MRSERYVVTEIEGFLGDASAGHLYPGLSVQVLDTAYCHRVVRSWRSEDYPRAGGKSPREQVRVRGQLTCEALNAGRPIPTYFGRRITRYTCADCGGECSRQAVRCAACQAKRRESPHGTLSRYNNRKCRCDDCRRAMRDHMRAVRHPAPARQHFSPTCPRCSLKNPYDAKYCVECDTRLYPASFYPERRR